MKRLLFLSALALVVSIILHGQGGSFPPSSGGSAAIACVGAPGNTTGVFRQQCQVTGTGAVWACNNAAGCTVAADWVAVGGGSGLGDPGSNGVVKRTALNTTAPALQTDISALGYIAGGGTANAQTATLSPAVTSLTNGLAVCWLPAAANTTTTPTLAVNGLTATTITKFGTTALVASDITTTAVACVVYVSPNFQLQNPQTANITSGLTGSATISYGAINDGTCDTSQTITVTGAATGAYVVPNWPSLASGLFGSMAVTSSNTVTITLCNLSGGTLTPTASSTFGAEIPNTLAPISPAVSGPGSAVAGHLATFADTTGKVIQDGGVVPPNPAGLASELNARLSGTAFQALQGTSFISISGWTLLNAGSNFWLNDFSNGWLSTSLLGTSSLNWRIAHHAIGLSPPYTIIFSIRCWVPIVNARACGFYQDDGTKLEGLEVLSVGGGPSIRVEQITNTTTDSSTVATASVFTSIITGAIVDNNTNRVIKYWGSGAWHQLVSEATGTFLTPTNYGFGGVGNTSNDGNPINNDLVYLCVASGTSCGGITP